MVADCSINNTWDIPRIVLDPIFLIAYSILACCWLYLSKKKAHVKSCLRWYSYGAAISLYVLYESLTHLIYRM